MDRMKTLGKFPELFRKYKYVILIILLGIGLMCIPSVQTEEAPRTGVTVVSKEEPSLEERLELLLSQIEGAGKVRVLLTEQAGECVIFQTDSDRSGSSGTESARTETVIITDSDRSQQGLVRQINPPVYLGAVVVCQGADRATVRLAVVQAVSNATGLGADKISVLKMK